MSLETELSRLKDINTNTGRRLDIGGMLNTRTTTMAKKSSSSSAPTGRSSHYAFGIRQENKVANVYKSQGYTVKQSPGSRGAADLICTKGSTTHYVQVKATRGGGTPYISSSEVGRLKSTATRNDATAVVAKVNSSGTSICYAKTGNKVK